jgi:deoxycytidylate deaminase
MKVSHIKKYMRLAKQVGEDRNPCYSRKIGVVLVDSRGRRPLGTGYNGPPRDTPHCDTYEYLSEFFWPQLSGPERIEALLAADVTGKTDDDRRHNFCTAMAGKGICPRRIIGCPSGKRLELCSCAHAEANAIVNASQDLHGAYMFCWCPLPCVECTKLIVNADINSIYCIEADAAYASGYGNSSRFLFEKAGISVVEHSASWYLEKN